MRWIGLLLLGIASFAALLVYGGAYALGFVLHELPYMGKTFDPVEWAKAGSCAGLGDWKCEEKFMKCERGPMVRTLLRDHLVVGKTNKGQAVTLLGSPGRTIPSGATCINYPLGYCSNIADWDFVQLCFDSTDVLVSKRRVQG